MQFDRRGSAPDGRSVMAAERPIVTPAQADLIRASFDAMWPMRSRLAELCYGRLFELTPEAQVLFRNDMERQRLKLMDMMAALVGALDRRELFQSLITHSGRQHAAFGVTPAQYAAFGEALIFGLAQQFGAAFTPELRAAWSALYAAVQQEMMRAGAPSTGSSPTVS